MKYKLFINYCDGTTQKWYPKKKKQITHSFRWENMESAYLKVTYIKGVHNDGTFNSKRDLLLALNAWTEPELLKHVEDGEWD